MSPSPSPRPLRPVSWRWSDEEGLPGPLVARSLSPRGLGLGHWCGGPVILVGAIILWLLVSGMVALAVARFIHTGKGL